MKRAIGLSVLVFSVAFLMPGCLGRAIGEAYEGVTGPKGVVKEVKSLGPKESRPLAGYANFEVGQIVDDFGGQVPPELLANIKPYILQRLAEKGLPTGKSGKAALIRGRVFYYEDASVSGHLFGPFEEALAVIELVDKSSGRVLGEAICIGRTTKSVRKGVDNKTQGMADAVVTWIDERYPDVEGRTTPKQK